MLDLVEGKWIFSQRISVLLDVGKRGLGRFLVAVDGRSFPETGDLPVTDLDLHHLRDVGGLARDHKGLGELEPSDACEAVTSTAETLTVGPTDLAIAADAGLAGVGRKGRKETQTPGDHHGREAAGSLGVMRLAGIEPATLRSGGARSIP